MEFEYSKRTKEYMEQLVDFMNQHVYPNEQTFHEQLAAQPSRWQVPPIMEELKGKARERGLWNLFLPESERGAGLSNLDYAPLWAGESVSVVNDVLPAGIDRRAQAKAYSKRVPSQKPRSFAPSAEPCERFSLLGT